jgi:exo-1,4-beta-D-glucosaminidase
LGSKPRFAQESSLDVAADGVAVAFAVPPQSATSFLQLELRDAANRLVSNNFYWVPAKLAQLDWGKSSYVNTPALSYADMRDLAGLPKAAVQVSARNGSRRGEVTVELTNSGNSVAFFTHLRAVKAGTDEEVVPVFWNDNFVSLLPADTRALTVSGLGDAAVEIKVDGWNVGPRTVAIH